MRWARSRTSTRASTGFTSKAFWGFFFCRKFNLIIAGLDNIAARRWINATLHDMVDRTSGEPDPSTIIPLIDGGTEGFKGQARVIVPTMTSCFDCSLDAFPPQAVDISGVEA